MRVRNLIWKEAVLGKHWVLPPATVVPLIISSIHLLQTTRVRGTDTTYAVDCAVQYLLLGGVCLLLENMGGSLAAWVLLSPIVTACVGGIGFHVVGNTFFRFSKPSMRASAGWMTKQ